MRPRWLPQWDWFSVMAFGVLALGSLVGLLLLGSLAYLVLWACPR